MNINEIKRRTYNALNKFYRNESFLLKHELCERCLAHRLAVYLEQQKFIGYYIDCEYNKKHLNEITYPKDVSNPNGNYIDIIITKRNEPSSDDLACFEIKRSKIYAGRKKDRENLIILTTRGRFTYHFGFYIILSTEKDKTKIELYQNGSMIEEYNLKEYRESRKNANLTSESET